MSGPRMRISVAEYMTGAWPAAAALVRDVYAEQYGADVSPSPDAFIVARPDADDPGGDGPDTVLACAGLTFGGDRPLFSEAYLDRGIEEEIGRRLGADADRRGVVEVGGLATRRPLIGREVVRATPIIAWCLGMQYILCTATRPLIRSLDRLGIGFVPFAVADPARLGGPEVRERWGTYYDREPQVGVIPLNALHRLFADTTGRYLFSDMQVSLIERRVAGHANP